MTVIAIEEAMLEKLRALPPEQQQEALAFVEFLHQQNLPKEPRLSLEGLWADLQVDLSKEEIDQARREAWANFPRERLFTESAQ